MWVLYRVNRSIDSAVREQRRQKGMASRLNDVLSTISLIHAFGRQTYEEDRFQAEIGEHLQSGMHTARRTAAVTKAVALVSALGMGVTVLFGAWEVLAGQLTPGGLLIFIAYVNSVYRPVRDLGRLSAKFPRALVSAARIAEILGIEPDLAEAPNALEAHAIAGDIRFEDVSFSYGDGGPALERVSFHIRAGEHVALVGPSGAGKSAILSLLLRLYDPQDGRVEIDGIDLRHYRRDSVRQEIGIVLQEKPLFGASIRENIACGKHEPTQEEIEAAARWAGAHEFILELPEGYDTVLSGRAITLSGVQRERLCLARALVKEPAILVMDEPPAPVDPAASRRIHKTMARIQRGKTLIVIAHEYADLASFDRIFAVKGGRVVESGRDEALKARGSYLSMVKRRSA
jgi:ABC-type multidrug transport system fused ATPase/permease subunit